MISEVIRRLTESWKRTTGIVPEEINCGSCFDFAVAVCKIVPKAIYCWDHEEGGPEFCDGHHCFLKHYDAGRYRYYDAECPDGVDDWLDLPFYKRTWLHSNLRNAMEKHRARLAAS